MINPGNALIHPAAALLELLKQAGYDADAVHPACYANFSYAELAELLAKRPPDAPDTGNARIGWSFPTTAELAAGAPCEASPYAIGFSRESDVARQEMAAWDPDRRASIQLQGTVRWSDQNTTAAPTQPSPLVVGSINFASMAAPCYAEGRRVIITEELVDRIARVAWGAVIQASGGEPDSGARRYKALADAVRAELEQ
jgi:hypothetical protein